MSSTLRVVTNQSTIAKAESFTGLLTDSNTLRQNRRAIALLKLNRIGKSLDRETKLLSRSQVQVFDVVGILRIALSARGGFVDSRQAIPSNAGAISAAGSDGIQNATVYASFVQTLASSIPGQFRHLGFLLTCILQTPNDSGCLQHRIAQSRISLGYRAL